MRLAVIESKVVRVPKAIPRILVVDDDIPLCEVLAELLGEELGYDVTTANSAEEALECLRFSHYDLMLSDVVMPGMSGVELAAIVRREYPDLKVLLSTGHIPSAILKASEQFPVLMKPYSLDKLRRTLSSTCA